MELTEEFQVARSKEQEPTIPSPRVFQPSQSNDAPIGAPFLPSVTQCAIHLELLEVFWHLKKRVTVTDAESFDVIFGHQGKGARYWRERRGWGVNRAKKESEWVEAERERVWRAYVELAVERFQRWWTRLDAALSERGKRDSVAELQSDSGSVKFFDKKDVIIRWSIEATGDPSMSAEGVLDDGVMSELPPHALPPLGTFIQFIEEPDMMLIKR